MVVCETLDEYFKVLNEQTVRHGDQVDPASWPKEFMVGFSTPSGEWRVTMKTVENTYPGRTTAEVCVLYSVRVVETLTAANARRRSN